MQYEEHENYKSDAMDLQNHTDLSPWIQWQRLVTWSFSFDVALPCIQCSKSYCLMIQYLSMQYWTSMLLVSGYLDTVTDSSYPAMSFFSASMISIRFEVLARCK